MSQKPRRSTFVDGRLRTKLDAPSKKSVKKRENAEWAARSGPVIVRKK
jgi:hypothetical protein